MITAGRPNNSGWPLVRERRITGIGGVLGEIISDDPPTFGSSDPAPSSSQLKPKRKSHARAGRPPGRVQAKTRRREKLTVRIDAELVDKYRDWSWDARCNLGELVGQAMRIHLKNRRRNG